MTNEQAIYKLKCDCATMNLQCECKGKECGDCYIKMAIEALKNKGTGKC